MDSLFKIYFKKNDEGIITDLGSHIFDYLVYIFELKDLDSIKLIDIYMDRYPQTNNMYIAMKFMDVDIEIKISRTDRLANKIYAYFNNVVLLTDSIFSNSGVKLHSKNKYNDYNLNILFPFGYYDLKFAFVLQLVDVISSIKLCQPNISLVHYKNISSVIGYFDLVRENYKIKEFKDYGV